MITIVQNDQTTKNVNLHNWRLNVIIGSKQVKVIHRADEGKSFGTIEYSNNKREDSVKLQITHNG